MLGTMSELYSFATMVSHGPIEWDDTSCKAFYMKSIITKWNVHVFSIPIYKRTSQIFNMQIRPILESLHSALFFNNSKGLLNPSHCQCSSPELNSLFETYFVSLSNLAPLQSSLILFILSKLQNPSYHFVASNFIMILHCLMVFKLMLGLFCLAKKIF